jgi:hypothetical protein
MKKEIGIHLLFMLPYLLLVMVFNKYFFIGVWPLWVGGVLGTLLPYADHFIYVYYLAPQELSSQRVISYLKQKQLWLALETMVHTSHERSSLIFHTLLFNAVIAILAFYVVTSSGSLFGTGVVLAFYLHLVVDMIEKYLADRQNYPGRAILVANMVFLFLLTL